MSAYKLYKVYNGYVGFSDIFVLTIANCEKVAIELAYKVYEKRYPCECQNFKKYNTLSAELLCDNFQKEWVSEVSE